MKDSIVVPFACPVIISLSDPSVPSRSPAEWVVLVGCDFLIRISTTDAPNECEARRLAIEIARKLKIQLTIDGTAVPIEVLFRNVHPQAIFAKTPLFHGGIRFGLSALVLLEPLSDLISLCA